MSSEMKRVVSRATALFTALGLGATLTIVSLLTPSSAHAFPIGGQVQNRAIYMSTAQKGAAAHYLVSFQPASTTSITGIIVDFCKESPIIGDSGCTSPDSGATTETFDVGGTTPTVTHANTTVAGGYPIATTGLPGTWTASGIDQIGATSRYRTLKLVSGAGGSGALDNSGATTYSFEVTSMVNPNQDTPGTFYARIITYTNPSPGTGDIASYAPGTEGSSDAKDYGGFALSTANVVSLTAKVQEKLTFCISGTDLGATDCSAATAPNLIIGSGTPPTIDSGRVDAAEAFTQTSTNAIHGVTLMMHQISPSTCVGMTNDGGASCKIPNITSAASDHGSVAADLVKGQTTGVAAVGLYVSDGTSTTGATGSTGYDGGTQTSNINGDANYHNASFTSEATATTGGLYYGWDDGTGATGHVASVTGSNYGDIIAASTVPVSQENNHLWFAATAGLTTPAGIYTATESIIATGTF